MREFDSHGANHWSRPSNRRLKRPASSSNTLSCEREGTYIHKWFINFSHQIKQAWGLRKNPEEWPKSTFAKPNLRRSKYQLLEVVNVGRKSFEPLTIIYGIYWGHMHNVGGHVYLFSVHPPFQTVPQLGQKVQTLLFRFLGYNTYHTSRPTYLPRIVATQKVSEPWTQLLEIWVVPHRNVITTTIWLVRSSPCLLRSFYGCPDPTKSD